MAINVGSVEVDVVPNTRGIYARLRSELEPVGGRIGRQLGDDIGRAAARQITSRVAGALQNGLQAGGRTAAATAGRQGNDSGGAFGRAFQGRVRAAMANLPRADVRLSDTGFNADLARLRSRLETLSGKRIGVDVDAARALAEVDTLDAELTRLGANHPDIQVRMDTGRARAELAALRTEIAAADANDVDIDVDVDTGAAMAAIFQLTIAIAGVAAIPAIPVLAAGIGSIAAAGTAAAAGVGALGAAAAPAIMDIAGALQAQKAAQDAAATATANGGQAAAQAAQQSLQMAGAQAALATAHRNAARQIAQAEQGVADAQRQAAEAARSAAAQIRDARRALADAYRQSAEQMRAADESVEDAEDQLADAQRTARQAQQDLTAARREARRELEDMNTSLAQSRLDERQAVLDLADAEDELQAARAAGVSGEALERLQIAYERAQLALEEQRRETGRLETDTAAASAAGVAGSQQVQDAQQQLADAQQAVADHEAALADARRERAQQEAENARTIAEAQQRVAEATRNASQVEAQGARDVAAAQQQLAAARQAAADSIAGAERQVAAAQLSGASGADAAATAQAKYQAALDKMTPATRRTFDSFLSLRKAFKGWSRELQPKVMPIFTRALDGMRRALPGLTPFVEAAAEAIGDLQDRASRGFKSQGWKDFKRDLSDSVGPAIRGIGRAIGNIGRGVGGVIQAFLPHMDSIEGRMVSITDRFGDWGQSLKGSPEFENFLSYASEMGPQLGDALGKIATAFIDIGRALAPLSGPVLDVLGFMAEAVSWLATSIPGLVQGIYLAIIATRLWTIGMVLFNAVMNANPIGLIVLAVAALVGAVIYAYRNFDWFREGVQAAWDGIRTAAVWTWENVLKPTFNAIADTVMWLWKRVIKPYVEFIIDYWRMVGRVAMWLWDTAIKPAFTAIGDIITWWWRNIVKRYFNLVLGLIRTWWAGVKTYFRFVKTIVREVGDVFRWLWREAIRPVMGWIGDRVEWVWDHAIKPAFDGIKGGVRAVGEAFEAAKDAIKRAWDRLKNIAKAPVNFVIGRVYNDGIRRVWNTVVGAFGGQKLDKAELLASGGILPGYTPGKDVHEFVSPTGGRLGLSGGEAIMRPEVTRGAGAGWVHGLNQIARTRGVAGVREALAGGRRGFALGGIWDGIGDVAAGAWDTIKDGASWLRETFSGAIASGVRAVVNPLLDLIPGSGRFTDLLKGGVNKVVEILLGAGERGDEEASAHVNYRPSAGVEQWRPVVMQALREVGQPGMLANTTLRRMQQESGGNPTIVNRWDSNWLAGHPSVGLMQVIGPTFRAYAGKYRNRGPFSYGVSVDPLANIYSSMKYALSRYGDLASAYNRPGGYDNGGWLMPGQLGYNGLSQPEAVLTPTEWRTMRSAAERGGEIGDINVRVYVGDREITDIVRTEVDSSQRTLATTLRAGRR